MIINSQFTGFFRHKQTKTKRTHPHADTHTHAYNLVFIWVPGKANSSLPVINVGGVRVTLSSTLIPSSSLVYLFLPVSLFLSLSFVHPRLP